MSAKKKIDPCQRKGRYLDTEGGGRKLQIYVAGKSDGNDKRSHVIYPSGCELQEYWQMGGRYKKQYYCQYDPKSEKEKFSLLEVTPENVNQLSKKVKKEKQLNEKGVLAKTLPAVALPCSECFLHKDSPLTLLFKKHNPESKFEGCYGLEKEIFENELVRYHPKEKVRKNADASFLLEMREIEDLQVEFPKKSRHIMKSAFVV